MMEDAQRRTPEGSGPLVEQCGQAVAGRLRGLLGDQLLAVYLIGSGALGGFTPDQSDIDIVAVCADPPPDGGKQAIVAALSQEAMSWPVRGLELVLYTQAAVAAPARTPRFEINLNVGPRMPRHLSLDPASEPSHWFVLDLSILREHGLALTGPPARELVGPVPRSWVLEALRDSLGWHAAHESLLHLTVLNASRGWRYVEEGVWSSKDDAGTWALSRSDDPSLVEAALAIRHGDRSRALDPARVDAFQRGAQAVVERRLLLDDQGDLDQGDR